ncbi:MAG: transglutaminase-like domain-containing protein [bacterium]|nr:transglutaminase-like domain-containing protein [bacterium]
MFFRSVFVFFVAVLLSVRVAQAVESDQPFESSIHTTYAVSLAGETTISHEFSLKNLTATSFISQYALKSPLQNLERVSANSNGKEVKTSIVETEDGTTISLAFDDQVVGENKVRKFTISYSSIDTAIISGNVLELYVPSISGDELYKKRSVTLKTPLRFGRATRVTPEPEAVSFTDTTAITNFPDLGNQGVVALFGDRQFYSLTLRYNLENTSNSQGIAQVALPPDTPYQKMQYQSLDPAPKKLQIDQDGNWIATYELTPNSAQAIYLTAQVRVGLWPSPDAPQTPVLPEHTRSQRFWEIDTHAILDVAKTLDTPQTIYEYVVDTLNYNLPENTKELTRKGAVDALGNPDDAVCQEFTDTFIALARAKNIPARRVTGYAYSSNNELRPLSLGADILHAWAEFYNVETNQWQQVDPTWGDTTGGADYFSQFDLNHIAFAINGVSSTTPYAAGSYKSESFESKDVSVELIDAFVPTAPDLSLALEPRKLFGLSIPGLYSGQITNNTGEAWYGLSVSLSTNSSDAKTHMSDPADNLTILPFQTITLPFLVVTDQVQLPQEVELHVRSTLSEGYDKTITFQKVKTGLRAYHYFNETIIAIILVSCLTLGTLITGSLLVFRRRR